MVEIRIIDHRPRSDASGQPSPYRVETFRPRRGVFVRGDYGASLLWRGETFDAVRPERKAAVYAVAALALAAGAPDGRYRVYVDGEFRWRGHSLHKAALSAAPYYVIRPDRNERGAWVCDAGAGEFVCRAEDNPEAYIAAALLEAGAPDGPWAVQGALSAARSNPRRIPGYQPWNPPPGRGASLRDLAAEVKGAGLEVDYSAEAALRAVSVAL